MLGFSQGAALAASMILQHTRDFPTSPADSLFKTAIFLCGSLPFDVHSHLGSAMAIGDEHETASTNSILAEFQASDKGETETLLNRFLPDGKHGLRIDIPTAHIYGDKDEYFKQSLALVGLCDMGAAKVFDHGGGHFLPRDQWMAKKMGEVVRYALDRARFRC